MEEINSLEQEIYNKFKNYATNEKIEINKKC